jgi:Zn-dependent membrane protease YugP
MKMYKFMRLRKDQDIVRSSGIAAALLIIGLIITQVTNYIELGFVFIVMGLILIIVIQAATSSKKT